MASFETDNRFAPPTARVEDVAVHEGSSVQPVRFWNPGGRLGRLRFMAWGSGLYVLFTVCTLAITFVVARQSQLATGILSIVLVVLYVVAGVQLGVQRSHDMNISGWWTIAAVIPLVGLFWVLKGGTKGSNRWGAPTPPNGVLVTILGLLFPAIFVIGILAAIALPAYQDYTKRARATAQP